MIEFMSRLRDLGHGTDEVCAYDTDAGETLPVTGATYGNGTTVKLYTDGDTNGVYRYDQ